jgi:hypothetical protein
VTQKETVFRKNVRPASVTGADEIQKFTPAVNGISTFTVEAEPGMATLFENPVVDM